VIEELTQILWRASEGRQVCRIKLAGEFLERVIHPYGIYLSTRNQIMLACWQVMGFTKAGGKPGYRNLVLLDIENIEVLERHFFIRDDFNPKDGQYKEWYIIFSGCREETAVRYSLLIESRQTQKTKT
jgi:hypothetical protein